MPDSSMIHGCGHTNHDVLELFSETADKQLLYRGKPIGSGDDSGHSKLIVYSEKGVHGLRYYNKKLQYYFDNKWNTIDLGTSGDIIINKDIIISPTKNNVLTQYNNGYYVPGFQVSSQPNNALVKYSDGYYVQKQPGNVATKEEIKASSDCLKEALMKVINENDTDVNTRIDIITDKLSVAIANALKFKEYNISGNNTVLDSVIDLSTLYTTEQVIANSEFMIVNKSEFFELQLQIMEKDLITMEIEIEPKDIQRYKLPNTPNIKINIQGEYNLYVYINYV